MRNKEWLKNSIITEKYYTEGRELKAKDSYEEGLAKGTRKGLQISLNLIDQLEESEQEKPVIPQFVAEYISNNKGYISLIECMRLVLKRDERMSAEEDDKWIIENGETFARAWLDGYTVEKEPQWVVKTGKNWFFKNFESVGEYNYQAIGTGSIEEAKKFKDKLEAESVALLSDGEVEEITK